MLFLKEFRRAIFSPAYLLFLGLLFFTWFHNFYGVTEKEINASKEMNTSVYSEITGASVLQKPEQNAQSYGSKKSEDPEKIMCGGTDLLIMEYLKNSYATYPFRYYKEVVLDEKEQNMVLQIIKEITGLDEEQIHHIPDDYFPALNGNIIHMGASAEQNADGSFTIDASEYEDTKATEESTEHFVPQVSYERFKELMKEIEEIIGAGSGYSIEMLQEYYGQAEMTYEEAIEEYYKTLEEDKVSTAFARLFCDYITRALGLYPVFLAAVFWLSDRKNRMNSLIDPKAVTTFRLILVRFLAILAAVMLPVVVMSFESLVPLYEYSIDTGIAIDIFAFLKYIFWWLLPTAMIVIAIGMFFTILTSTPVAILIQFVWWFLDSAATGLSGDTKWYTLMIRHNQLKGSEIIRQNLEVICVNRGLLVLFSVLLLWLSVVVYKKRRGGNLEYGDAAQKYWRFFKNRFSYGIQK